MEIELSDLLQRVPPGMLTCVLVMTFLLWGGFWAIFAWIFQRNLAAVPEEHRQMRPAASWWLVPFPVAFGFLFYAVIKISNSWRSLFDARGNQEVGTCGKTVGLTTAVLALLSNILSLQPLLGGSNTLTAITQIASLILGLAGFILLIVYVIVINDLKLKSQAEPQADQPNDA